MIEKFFTQSPSLESFIKKATSDSKKFWHLENLTPASKSLFISLIKQRLQKEIIFVTSEKKEDLFLNDLSSLLGKENLLEFSSWEIIPGETIAPSKDLMGHRLKALSCLSRNAKKPLVLTSLHALLQKVVDLETLKKQIEWAPKDVFSFRALEKTLIDFGYERVAVVSDRGEFAIRNGILDIFSLTHPLPYRIDFWDDEITEIRTFDPGSQKTVSKELNALISFADEKKFIQQAAKTTTFLDYFSSDVLIILDDPIALEEQFIIFKNLPHADPTLFLTFDQLFEKITSHPLMLFTKVELEKLSPVKRKEKIDRYFEELDISLFNKDLTFTRFFHPFYSLEKYFSLFEISFSKELFFDALQFFKDKNIFFTCLYETESEKRSFLQLFENKNFSLDPLSFQEGYLSSGVVIGDIPYAFVPYGELKTKYKIHRQENRLSYHTPIAEFHTLKEGDLVVHFHSGIGKYLGIEKVKDIKGEENEFFLIEYGEGGKLFVPLSQAHLLSRYIGSQDEHPTLDVLGSQRFIKTKAQAQRKILGYAQELLLLYAERSALKGFSYPPDSDEMKLFELDFPYQETLDQLQAIQEIKTDMESAKIMDRLLLGDVGYGKTEVAMRAAFKTVMDGKKQVAVLVPTTVLAMQHKDTFRQRMTNFPIMVEAVSRFNTTRENQKILAKVKEGKVDILIGTHRMLSKDVEFHHLGLLIIDEEQRFGVRAKEKIKSLKKDIDCLTLSATPIPRTLYLSLVKARDMSVINTPPQDRLPIKTIIAEAEDSVIENALLRELLRGGQSFFIHNHVETLPQRTSYLEKLVPRARFAIVHGQMDSELIDQTFHLYKEGKIDVLVSTTILENGIDIFNANTLIVDQAHTFGLGNLYQLRGRVGRGNRMAYAYFLIPKKKELSEIARKRLSALIEAGGFGSGFKIAMRDLENRGAGDFLGEQQSGQVTAIGFHLYCKLLKQAIAALQSQKPVTFMETKIESIFPAKLPEKYIAEASIRMEIYHRLGSATLFSEVDEIFDEVKDRFGAFPVEALFLYGISKIRIFAQKNQFTLLKFGEYTLLAKQRRQGKKEEVFEKNLPYPKKFSVPQEWQEWALLALKNHFSCED